MKVLAERMGRFGESASMRASKLARELTAGGRDIISLTAGEPDFPTADHIKAAAIEALRREQTKYTNVDGTPALKEAVQQKFKSENGLQFSANEIIVATGAKQVIFNALMATVESNDEVIVPAPCWVSYLDIVQLFKGKPVVLPCNHGQAFKLSPQQLERAITDKTRWLLLNSPCNPSGATYSHCELKALTDVLIRHPHVWILADDIYESIVYDGAEFATLLQVEPRLRARVLTVNGVSKAHAMTGWRIGYGAGPSELIKAMGKLQSQSTSAPSSVGQAAALAALTGDQQYVRQRTAELQVRRNFVVQELNGVPGLTCHTPEGAFYAFASCAGALGKIMPSGRTVTNDEDFALYLLESVGVGVVHGAAFSMSPYVRISFAASMEMLRDGCARIRQACVALRGSV